MIDFLSLQSDTPFDPVPMLIRADWLEEHGDAVGAAELRGLAEAGTPSLRALALDVELRSALGLSSEFAGYGFEDRFGYAGIDSRRYGAGFGDGFGVGDAFGDGDGSGYVDRDGIDD